MTASPKEIAARALAASRPGQSILFLDLTGSGHGSGVERKLVRTEGGVAIFRRTVWEGVGEASAWELEQQMTEAQGARMLEHELVRLLASKHGTHWVAELARRFAVE